MKTMFETKNLFFNQLSMDYLNDYFNMFNSYDYYHNFEINHVQKTKDNIKEWINKNRDFNQYTIINKANNSFVGICGFNYSEGYPEEISLCIVKKYQGKGLGKEVLAKLIDIGFNELNLDKLEVCIFNYNNKSISLFKNNGFLEYDKSSVDTFMELKKK